MAEDEPIPGRNHERKPDLKLENARETKLSGYGDRGGGGRGEEEEDEEEEEEEKKKRSIFIKVAAYLKLKKTNRRS